MFFKCKGIPDETVLRLAPASFFGLVVVHLLMHFRTFSHGGALSHSAIPAESVARGCCLTLAGGGGGRGGRTGYAGLVVLSDPLGPILRSKRSFSF